jgi:putative transposase
MRLVQVIHQLPGAVNQRHERGDKDERIDAVLTTNDFRKIVIHFVLAYNRSIIERFRFQEFMIVGNVEARPTDLWEWGIKNRAGHLRTLSADALRLNLLPRGEATVTERGVRFEKLYYTCTASELGQWQVKARVHRSWKVEVAYHPHHTEILYLVNGDRYEPCSLMQSNLHFGGRAWRELQDLKVIQSFRKDGSATAELQTRTDCDTQIAAIVSEAMQRREGVEPPPSKAAAVADIRENRMEERDRERAIAAAQHVVAPEQPDNVVPIQTIPVSDEGYVPGYVPPPSDFNLLRAQRAKHRKT